MIKDKLIPKVIELFSEKGPLLGSPPEPIITFGAAHPAVGDLTIRDDGDEATVSIGIITHFHVNPYDPELNQEQIDDIVTEEVIEFLTEIFEDRILMWRTQRGSGGCQYIEPGEHIDPPEADANYFLWSGPYEIEQRG